MDFGCGGVGQVACGCEVIAQGGYGEDAPAVGDELIGGIDFGACVKDGDAGHGLGIFDAGDGFTCFVRAGVSGGAHDDADGDAGVEVEVDVAEFACGGGPEDFDEIALQAWHDDLAFRITKAAVELQHFGSGGSEHEAGVEDAAVLDAFSAEGVDGGDDDLTLDGVHEWGVDQRCGAVGAHATGVGAGITFIALFVVLAGVEKGDGAAVDEGKDADFLSGEFFLDNDFVSSVAKLTMEHHAIDGIGGFFGGITDDDALACCEACGFDDTGVLAALDIAEGGLMIGEDAGLSGWDCGLAHQLFGECFVGFELGSCF